jgi:hypothetical protein
MMKPIISAAALSLMLCSAAWASPPSTGPHLGISSSDVVQVGKDNDRDRDGIKHKWSDRQAFDDDRRDYRYKSWKRYSYRPYDDWETRGCVSVGPVWYCP